VLAQLAAGQSADAAAHSLDITVQDVRDALAFAWTLLTEVPGQPAG
jgi:hypothetical protein